MRLRIRMLRSMRQSMACRPTGAGEKSKASATQSSSRNSQSIHVWPERCASSPQKLGDGDPQNGGEAGQGLQTGVACSALVGRKAAAGDAGAPGQLVQSEAAQLAEPLQLSGKLQLVLMFLQGRCLLWTGFPVSDTSLYHSFPENTMRRGGKRGRRSRWED